jgi:hypothetical protein
MTNCNHPDYCKRDGRCLVCEIVKAVMESGGPGGKCDNRRDRQAERAEQRRNNAMRRKYAARYPSL